MFLAFPYDHVIAGALVLLLGFVFHWMGQAISVFNWDLAVRLGLQEKAAPPEYRVYEHAIAVADASIGWLYGIAGLGLLLDAPWGYKLAWVPGVIFVYHGISFWVWTHNQYRAGYQLIGPSFRIVWALSNLVAGILVILVAWNA